MICPGIYHPHSGSHHGSHHGSRVLQRYPRRLHHSDRKHSPLSKERHNRRHTDLSVTILRFPFPPRDTEQGEPPAPPTALGERACMIPTTPVLRQRGCCVPMVFSLVAIRPGRASRRLAGGTLTSTSLSMLYVSNAKLGQSPDPVIRGEMAETWKCSSDRDLHLPGII